MTPGAAAGAPASPRSATKHVTSPVGSARSLGMRLRGDELQDVIHAEYDAVLHNAWIGPELRLGASDRGPGHAPHLSLDVEHGSSAHTREAGVAHEVALVNPVADDGLR